MIETRARLNQASAGPPIALPRSRSKRAPRPCPCGSCQVRQGFCDAHLEVLHRIRDELGGSLVATGRFHQTSMKRGYKPPACCLPDCDEPRARGATYCIEHSDLEDEAA